MRWAITAWLAAAFAWLAWLSPPLASIDACARVACDFIRFYYPQAEASWSDAPRVVQGWYYPPGLALLLRPAVGLGFVRAARWWTGVELASALVLVACCAHTLRDLGPRMRWAAALGLVVCSLPVWHALKWGQISLPIYAAIIGGTLLGPTWGAVASAAGGALKLYPAAFALTPLLHGHRRAVLWALAAALGAGVLLPLAVFGGAHTSDLLRSVFAISPDAVASMNPQGLVATLVRWMAVLPRPVAVAVAIGAAIVVLWTTARTLRTRPPPDVALALALLAVVWVLLPTGWHHAFAFLPWVQAVLWAHVGERRDAKVALGLSIATAWLPLLGHELAPSAFTGFSAMGVTSLSAACAWLGLVRIARDARDFEGPDLASRWRVLDAAIVVVAALQAVRVLWLGDDGFISFRHAENLVAGHGLVFNAGERVEGITNPLWTLWLALGVGVGVRTEIWAVASGVCAFAGTTAVLIRLHVRAREALGRTRGVPFAALALALHPEAAIWATGGLEGPMVTLLLALAVAAWSRALRGGPDVYLWLAGLATAAAAATRHDAILVAPVLALTTVAVGRRTPRATAARVAKYAAACACLWVPFNVARVIYYGDFYPNTYYAKSADLAWWSQGLAFVSLYYERYAMELAGLVLLAVAWWRRRGTGVQTHIAAACLGFVVLYAAYVARVGGDFMFARLLVPTAAFALLALDLLTLTWSAHARGALLAVTVAMPWIVGPPVHLDQTRHEVANEWEYYSDPGFELVYMQRGQVLRRYLADAPVRLAFLGGYARAMRDADIPVAIESETGLTDATIARQPLRERGRPGHEKTASPEYLTSECRAHFAVGIRAYEVLGLDAVVPPLQIVLPDADGILARGETLWVLCWDPAIIDGLRGRGAIVPDLQRSLDEMMARLDGMSDDEVAKTYAGLRRVYFDHVFDPRREAAFERRLSRASR